MHDTTAPARFGVMPRHFEGGVEASKGIRWFQASTCFVYHMVRAAVAVFGYTCSQGV